MIAIEESGFLVVERNDYNRILKRSLDVEALEKYDFCAELPFMAACSARELQKISSIMTKKQYQQGAMIFAQGEESNNFYFVLSGEVRVVHYLKIRYESADDIERQRLARLKRLSTTLSDATTVDLGTSASSAAAAAASAAAAATETRADSESGSGARSYFSNGATAAAVTASNSASSGSSGHASAASGARGVSIPPLALGAAKPGASSLLQKSSTARPALASARADVVSGSKGASIPRTALPSARMGAGSSARHTVSAAEAAAAQSARDQERAERSQRALESFRQRTEPKRQEFELVDLGLLGPRQFFGELGILDKKPRSASVFASTRVELLILSKGDFESKFPESALEYLRNFRKLYPTYDQIMSLIQQQQKWGDFKDKILREALPKTKR